MFKSIVSAAVMASALFAYGANVGSVSTKMGTLAADGSTYTATSLEYKTSPSNSSAPYRTQKGWYAGIQLTWDTEAQNAKNTKASVSDSPASLNNTTEYTVYNNGDKTPTGCGMKNTTKTTGNFFNWKYWMDTTEWYIYVTPEFMYSLGDADYSATLTIGGNEYTITVPQTIELFDGDGVKWYPAVGLLGDTVYGDAQYLAGQITLDNYTTVKFLSDPSGLDFPDGKFKAGAQGEDGKWSVELNHQHSWSFPVSADGATLTATCGSEGCPYETTTVSLTLSGSDKVYDNKAITASADFGSSFKTIFPDAEATISTTKDGEPIDNDKIKDAGEYVVTMTVTGLSGGQSRDVSRNVTISKVDISEAALVLTPATTTYNGKAQTVTPSVTANNLSATIVVDTENSITSATEMGTYSVTVNGTGNFTGSATATWSIVNTTGSFKSVTSAVDGIGSIVNENSTNTLTIANSKALEYSDGSWFAGITLEWPVETKDWQAHDWSSYAHYVTEDSVKISTESGEITHSASEGSYRSGVSSYPKFDYLASTTWKVAITPVVVEAALSEEKTALEWTMRAGAIKSDTYANGVAFADYTITLPLDEPVEFVLGEGESYDLGDTELTTTKIQLAAGASVTSSAEQTVADALYTDVTGYDIVCSEEDGKYVYTAQLTHQHKWNVSKAENGYELVATCANDECDINAGVVKMWLDVGTTEKPYDGNSVTRFAVYGDGFKTVYPDSTNVVLTVNGVKDGVINDAGTYEVVLTVTGVGEDTYTLSRTVTISKVDITGATLVLSSATTLTYNGTEQTVTPSVNANGLAATIVVDTENSITSATEMGTYSVTVNGTGNFTGSATATWSIVNTTGSLSGVTSAVSGIGDYDSENNTLTVTDSTALEYSDGAWYAGLTLTWPVEAEDFVALGRDGYAQYVKSESMLMTIDGNEYRGNDIISGEVVYDAGKIEAKEADGSYNYRYSTGHFSYLATTTWKVAVTPAIIEAALAEGKTSLTNKMNAGAFVWEDGREGDSDGVAFADYTITLPLDEPVEFVLGEGESYDLGDTELTTTKIQLAAGASVTSSVEQTVAAAIYTTETGYDVVCTEDGGKYVYTAKITHVHDWTYSVDGATLTATCGAAECTVEGNATTVSLNLSSGDKNYDNTAIAVSAVFDGSFKTVFPDAEATISTTKDGEPIDNDEIKDAGEYVVTMTVTGLSGGQSRDVSRNVTISKVDISEAALVLTPANPTYTGAEQTVTPSVTANNLTATFDVDTENSTTAATEMGTYTVIVNGTGNFTGSTSATWSIVNTTGTPTSVAASAAGSMTNVGNDFTLSDSSKLEYDAEKGEWYAGITINWPMSKTDYAWYVIYTQQGSAKYVKEESAKITTVDGFTTNVMETASYKTGSNASKDFTYLSTTTWKVPLTPEIIKAAIAEAKTSLTYTMNAGAFIWGDDTEGDPTGVAFRDYTITIPLNKDLKLYDGDGKQVYPMTPGQTIIEGIKSDIAEAVSGEVAADASAKIYLLAEVAGEGNEQDVADWVDGMKGEKPAEFFEELAQCDYVKASFKLETDELITDISEVEVAEFEATEGGFTFAIRIDGDDIEAARVMAARIIKVGTDLGSFGPLSAERIKISVEGGMTVEKDVSAGHEFFKIVIDKDDKVD